MIETAWLDCTDPMPLLEFLRHSGKLTQRKAQLFAAACCRGIWHLLTDPRGRRAVEVAEQHAEGRIGNEQVMAAWELAWDLVHEATDAVLTAGTNSAVAACELAAEAAGNALAGQPFGAAFSALNAARTARTGGWDREEQRQATLLRDLFGPLPFRVVPIEPPWRTAVVKALATSISAEGRFQDLPVLADALEEAGCTDAELLAHLRSPGPHVCGCFALDLILGKK